MIKLTAPGVPDIYQGTEIWDLSLVDPDNRRPVDFGMRRCLLEQLESMSVKEILNRADEGLPKLWVITRALKLRAMLGLYAPLPVTGDKRDRAIAYSRGSVITVAPRLPIDAGDWGDAAIELPAGKKWRNVLASDELLQGRVSLCKLFRMFPVALLAAS